MLRTFVTRNYRNVRIGTKGPPKFERINLLIGPNNSGKSNFMKALGFLRDMLLSDGEPTAFLHTAEKHGRSEAINRTVRAKLAKGNPGPNDLVIFQWVLDSLPPPKSDGLLGKLFPPPPPSDLVYYLGYAVGKSESFPGGFYIRAEGLLRQLSVDYWAGNGAVGKELFSARCHDVLGKAVFAKASAADKNQSLSKIEFPVENNETMLRQAKAFLKDKEFYTQMFPTFERASDELQAFARGFRTYSSTELDLRKLAEGAKIDLSIRALDSEGSQFVNVLRYLDQEHDFLDGYVEHVRELLKDLKKVKVVDISDTQKQVDLDIGGHKYRPREMSDGTLKALWLALLLFSPVQQSLLAIDEPELNLHPAWLKVIGGWLQRFCSAEQLFVSTHSPDLLDTFTEGFRTGQVALFVFGAGEQEIRRVETPELDEFFREGWELGDLYRIGEPKLGGWPW